MYIREKLSLQVWSDQFNSNREIEQKITNRVISAQGGPKILSGPANIRRRE